MNNTNISNNDDHVITMRINVKKLYGRTYNNNKNNNNNNNNK